MTYTFISPIKANRDLVAAKMTAKGIAHTKRQEMRTVEVRQLIHDEQEPEKIVGTIEGGTKDVEMFIVEGDEKP